MKKARLLSKLIGLSLVLATSAVSASFASTIVVHADEHAHNYSERYSYDESCHWRSCRKTGCDVKTSVELHSFSLYMDTGSTTPGGSPIWDIKCYSCGYIEYGVSISECPYTHSVQIHSDENGHYQYCTKCGTEALHVEHDFYNRAVDCVDGDCTKGIYYNVVCGLCGYVKETNVLGAANSEHDVDDKYINYVGDETGHWQECKVKGCNYKCDFGDHYSKFGPQGDENGHTEYCRECGYKFIDGPHEYETTSVEFVTQGTCINGWTHHKKCKVCNYETDEVFDNENHSHNPDEEWSHNDTHHWHVCNNAGCTEQCSYSFHDFDVERVEHCEEEGYEKSTCATCGYKIETILPAKGHSYYRVAEVEATEEHDGCLAHYRCHNCDKLFKKSNGDYVETAIEELVVKYEAPAKSESKNYAAVIGALCGAGAFMILGTAALIIPLVVKKKKAKQEEENK